MAFRIIPVAIGLGVGALILKSQKKETPKQLPPPSVTEKPTSSLTKQEKLQADISNVVSGTYTILTTVVGAAGVVATIAGTTVSVVCGYVAAIAVIVIAIVAWSVRGGQDAQFVSDALRKGQQGLLDDMANCYGQIASKMVANGMFSAAKAHQYALGMARAYNDMQYLAVSQIPWGNAFIGWTQHYQYWADRAMFLQPAYASRLGESIASVMGMDVSQSVAGEYQQEGYSFGLLLWVWLVARVSMLEKWHWDWIHKRGFIETGWVIHLSDENNVEWNEVLMMFMLVHHPNNQQAVNPALQGLIGVPKVGGIDTLIQGGGGASLADVTEEKRFTQTFGPFTVDWSSTSKTKIAVSGGMTTERMKQIDAANDYNNTNFYEGAGEFTSL